MLSKEDIKHIAKLARLEIDPNELSTFQNQLSSILEYVKKLQEIDTTNIPELVHAAQGSNVLRDDKEIMCHESAKNQIIESFPKHEGRLLEVQAVFDESTDPSL
ncbi:Asp-tRNA(Asn)/Glu-tRNA(Gln) amidotransferase GatCAB subunit C [Candidatus Uhrbacteria bacterium CG_4_9_14_3_um_filter_36_7]|uniref:Aspartyl/glutamyl-tRNA(Asn/Gln) amidotransferase subunit C n=1 Tax=Candidatus Uhrbacteria bacterium CG_4_9_14_3_um_filter_36_7 TaxID=1975033 RepID=A0A2M7XH28_9BACT|nr:MAG: Asp-tRNA(Asn)/Glu-tRNA(Gln) amidotransferase GatCAB subunit C [Candidatus Uhrbacteria bacterium CG_4_9_14_3_um_filter_36_7]